MPMVPCQQCGTPFNARPWALAEGYGKYCTRECYRAAKRANPPAIPPKKKCGALVPCLYCGERFYASPARGKRPQKKYCSRPCYIAHRHALALEAQEEVPCNRCGVPKPLAAFGRSSRTPTKARQPCKECRVKQQTIYYKANKSAVQRYKLQYRALHLEHIQAKNSHYSQTHREERRAYFRKFPDIARNNARIRRARKRNAPYVEKVELQVVYERDKAICTLCHMKVVRSAASIDHVIPLSKGGEHSYRNCVLAHRRCNSSKGNRPVPQQMRLLP